MKGIIQSLQAKLPTSFRVDNEGLMAGNSDFQSARQELGYISYHLIGRKLKVSYIKAFERGQGVATQLMAKAIEENPGINAIEGDMSETNWEVFEE